jgi:hypothetical protein
MYRYLTFFESRFSGLWCHLVMCHNPDDCNLNLHWCENFRSCILFSLFPGTLAIMFISEKPLSLNSHKMGSGVPLKWHVQSRNCWGIQARYGFVAQQWLHLLFPRKNITRQLLHCSEICMTLSTADSHLTDTLWTTPLLVYLSFEGGGRISKIQWTAVTWKMTNKKLCRLKILTKQTF